MPYSPINQKTPPIPHLPTLIHALLIDPVCYDHAVSNVQVIETHISWVLLTGKFAYKIKKPVDLGFLDFSTLALRRQACAEEVRLNRRLAPEYYLGVIPITVSPQAPRVNGQGVTIEYAVKMLQFEPDATLDRLSERGELGSEHIDTLSARLAKFHMNECPAAHADTPWGLPDTIAEPVGDNFRILAEHIVDHEQKVQLQRLQDWSLAEHERLGRLMLERKQQGRVRECHGDLHLGNLAWVGGQLVIFDCIEFSPALRWIDVISEVAFCFMDLQHRHHRDLAYRFLNKWLEATGDYQGVALLRYYAVYRALVRAKVATLRAEQQPGSNKEVGECLHLAEQLVQAIPLQLWITHGFSGSGKTTLSQTLLQEKGVVRIRSDIERKRLAKIAPDESSGSGVDAGLYTPEFSRRTYDCLAALAGGLLDEGWPVIVDAAFLKRWQRDQFRNIARMRNLDFSILDVQADTAVLRERITLRSNREQEDASEADLRVLQHQIDSAEPIDPDEAGDLLLPP